MKSTDIQNTVGESNGELWMAKMYMYRPVTFYHIKSSQLLLIIELYQTEVYLLKGVGLYLKKTYWFVYFHKNHNFLIFFFIVAMETTKNSEMSIFTLNLRKQIEEQFNFKSLVMIRQLFSLLLLQNGLETWIKLISSKFIFFLFCNHGNNN